MSEIGGGEMIQRRLDAPKAGRQPHERPVGASVEWYTPPSLFAALGLVFDLDPAAAPQGSPHSVPAARFIRPPDDGLLEPWEGRVWLNPPYGPAGVPFIERMVAHRNGLALLPARTETRIFQRAAAAARLVVFLRDRLHFIRPDGHQSRASFASVLMVFGNDEEIHGAVRAADLGWSVYSAPPRFIGPADDWQFSSTTHRRPIIDARARTARPVDL